MEFAVSLSASSIASLPPSRRSEFLASLSVEELQFLNHDWRVWARPDQLAPPEFVRGDKSTWAILAGRGYGKTRTGAETVNDEVERGRARRLAIVAETAADARDVMVEGPSGILATANPWFMPKYEPSKRKITWPNGAIAHTYNATEPDQLRGPQHDFAWCDELAKWRYAQETWDQLQFGLRIGNPRQMVTTTPRPIPIVREILADEFTVVTRGRTLDNAANLSSKFLHRIVKRYQGTRLGRQELNAELLDDLPGALWTRQMLETALIDVMKVPPLQEIVVSVDPSGIEGDEDEGDSIGILVAGRAGDNAYILEDMSCREGPAGWAKVACDAYHRWGADRIIAERNYGGAMVRHTIHTHDKDVPYREVVASRGKFIRAEPVSALYEQGRVRHVGVFANLEDQMTMLTRAGYEGRGSPDRLDAAVWAITDLMLGEGEARAGVGEMTGIY
jgi:phage terminase large subunit-like protein